MKSNSKMNIKNSIIPNNFQETIIQTEMNLKKDSNNINLIKKLLYLYCVINNLKKRLQLNIMILRIIVIFQNTL